MGIHDLIKVFLVEIIDQECTRDSRICAVSSRDVVVESYAQEYVAVVDLGCEFGKKAAIVAGYALAAFQCRIYYQNERKLSVRFRNKVEYFFCSGAYARLVQLERYRDRVAQFVNQRVVCSPADVRDGIVPAQQALSTRGDVRITDLCPQFGLRGDRPDSGQKVAFADAAVTRQSACDSVPTLNAGDLIDPLAHEFRRCIGKMVCAERSFRVICKITQDLVRPDFDYIFYFFLNSFHAFGFPKGSRVELDREEAKRKCSVA